MDEYKFPHDPIANGNSTITGPTYRFTVLDKYVLRYEWAADGIFEDRASTFALFRKFPRPDFRVRDAPEQLEIITPILHLTYDKQRFSPNGLSATFADKASNWSAEWRFGQGRDEGNLGGTARTLDEVDGRCEVGDGILSRSGYAALDDTESMLFDRHGFVSPRKEGERVDGYLFGYGFDFRGAMESFYAISGPQPPVPRWCLGNWWSRYHNYSQEEYLGLMRKFREEGVPLSVAVLDMDWHWVKEAFVPHSGWTGYSWNTRLFPDPEGFVRDLHEMRLKVTLNDHPHLGVHSHEDVYEELARVLGHDTSHKDPIPFDPTSPTFMHAYFNTVHRQLEEKGCDFWWVDWQQGTYSRVPGFDPLWLLNHFQYLDTKKQSQSQSSLPLIFSRYAGPGSHRYPVGFSGDTVASWASLQFQPEFTATASNIGFGWWSHDIGGHLRGARDDECATRWLQLGVFSPILRLHSTHSPWMSKEPWLYRSEYGQTMRAAMQLRHRLVPYVYSLTASSHAESHLPLIQPLYWSFPRCDAAYKFPNTYAFGPSLLVSPIVTPRDPHTNLAKVTTWVPPGRHVDLFTGTVYDGDRQITFHRPIDQLPVLLREGAILPLDHARVPQNGCSSPNALEVLVVVGKSRAFFITEDPHDEDHDNDRDLIHNPAFSTDPSIIQQNFRRARVMWIEARGTLACECPDFPSKKWIFRFLSAGAIDYSGSVIAIESRSSAAPTLLKPDDCFACDGRDLVVTIPADANPMKIGIVFNHTVSLAVLPHKRRCEEMLRDWQMPFQDKDRVWKVLNKKELNAARMVSELLTLNLEEKFVGPLVELLTADHRTDGREWE